MLGDFQLIGQVLLRFPLELVWYVLTCQQFARYYLMRLGIGHNRERIALDPKYLRRQASEAELLALRSELIQTE